MSSEYDLDKFNKTTEPVIPDNSEESLTEEEPIKPADKSTREGRKIMWEEMRTWRKLPSGHEDKDRLKQEWYQNYQGMSSDEYEAKKKEAMNNQYHPIKRLDRIFQTLSVPGLGTADFGFDVLGNIPGMGKIDDLWDEKTKLDSPINRGLREISSVIIPTIMTSGATKNYLLSSKLPAIQKALVGAGLFGAQEAAVIGLSDVGEGDNIPGMLANTFPETFSVNGRIPFPKWFATQSGDSTRVRKLKNMLDTAGLSILGTAIGFSIDTLSIFRGKNGSRRVMDWFEPVDESSVKYKQLNLLDESEPDKIIRRQEINEILQTKKLSKQNERTLVDELIALDEELGTVEDLGDAWRKDSNRVNADREASGRMKLTKVKQGELELEFDPDISPGVISNQGSARQSVPVGNVAKNMADTTAIKNGTSKGDPAPIITDAMREKGLMVGDTSRGAVMGLAEETRDIGRFNALVDGFRYSSKQMNAAAWDIYTSIMAADNMDDVRNLFLENRDVKNMLLGRFKVEHFNEEQARAAAFAMRDLTDRFLGREVTEASARTMDTLGREAATMADAIQKLEPAGLDTNRAMDLIIDKMQFLMDEYGLNKYISGWQLRNKNWFDQVPPKELDTVIEQLTKEFTSAENAIHAKNMRFTQTLKEIKKTKPYALRPLVDAFAHTNGDVDSMAKLMKWAGEQVTPTGMIKSPDPKELNLFTRGAWSVVYNNVLSGLSAFRAALGNTSQLTLKPITAVLGHGFWGPADSFEGLKRTFYYNGAVFETNRRALSDAFEMMKRTHQNPETMAKAYRKDFIFQSDKRWKIMDDMAAVWEKEGNYGKLLQYNLAKGLKEMGRMKALRYGMTGMVFPDVFTSTHLAHYLSRVRAYDDVFSEFGFADWKKINLAEVKHYKEMFDPNGLPKDKVLQSITGEVALNLDDGLANWINKGTTAYPIAKFAMMFPRTSSNYIKNSLSWTPISMIPGINKYSKTIYANTDDDIAAALLEHGIDMASTPNAKVIWENLRAEYTGRLMFSGLLAGTLWQYSMGGNIRGNGHYNASRRKKERDEMGYDPKTINIAGKWFNYKGIIGVEQVLSILGDMSYYASDMDQALLEDWQAKLTWTIAATFLNETPLQGLEPIIAATNGDISGWNRLISNSSRAMLPLSGGAGVVANAIDSAQKDLSGSITDYVKNRLPGFKGTLANRVDIWTGDIINDIDNPWLKILNALSPIQVSGGAEPWRVWLQQIGYDGQNLLTRHSDGYEYSETEREDIHKLIGDQKLYKELERLMKSTRYKKELKLLKLHRSSNADVQAERLKLKTSLLPVHQEIDNILKRAKAKAEFILESRDDLQHINRFNNAQELINKKMQQGDVEGAADIQKQATELISIPK